MVSEPTVFIIDDDPAMTAVQAELIGLLGLKTACFRSASEFLATCQPSGPGCLVLDVHMPGMSGLELQKELTARGIELPTIFVTGFGDVRMAVEAMKAGAIEFLEKPFRSQELCDLVQRAIRLDVARWQDRKRQQEVQQKLETLSRAEREVLELIVAGKTNRMIASELELSTRTIEDRRARMMPQAEDELPAPPCCNGWAPMPCCCPTASRTSQPLFRLPRVRPRRKTPDFSPATKPWPRRAWPCSIVAAKHAHGERGMAPGPSALIGALLRPGPLLLPMQSHAEDRNRTAVAVEGGSPTSW